MLRNDKEYSHARWCDFCEQYHGILYICKSYSLELSNKLMKDNENYIEHLKTLPDTLETAILKFFAGVL